MQWNCRLKLVIRNKNGICRKRSQMPSKNQYIVLCFLNKFPPFVLMRIRSLSNTSNRRVFSWNHNAHHYTHHSVCPINGCVRPIFVHMHKQKKLFFVILEAFIFFLYDNLRKIKVQMLKTNLVDFLWIEMPIPDIILNNYALTHQIIFVGILFHPQVDQMLNFKSI